MDERWLDQGSPNRRPLGVGRFVEFRERRLPPERVPMAVAELGDEQ